MAEGQDEQAKIAAGRANFERAVGEVLLFLAVFPPFDEMFLREAPERIIRPLALRQFEITRSKDGQILGYTSWAMASKEVAARLRSGEAPPLCKEDWNSGDEKVIVDQIGLTREALTALKG